MKYQLAETNENVDTSTSAPDKVMAIFLKLLENLKKKEKKNTEDNKMQIANNAKKYVLSTQDANT